MMRCHKCGREWVTQKRVKEPGVKETCEGCEAYLHCCLNCEHYDPAVHNQCRSTTAEWTVDKEGANFCGDFRFRDAAAERPSARSADEQGKGRQALDQLFGPSDTPSDRDRLDQFKNLFGE